MVFEYAQTADPKYNLLAQGRTYCFTEKSLLLSITLAQFNSQDQAAPLQTYSNFCTLKAF